MKIRAIHDRATWHTTIRDFPQSHVLQSWDWGEFKRQTTGWQPERLLFVQDGEPIAAASILTRTLGPLRLQYVPKGPLFRSLEPADTESVLNALQRHARLAVWLKIDPDVVLATGLPADAEPDDDHPHVPYPTGQTFREQLQRRGWRFSDDQIQFRNTMTLDLSQSEDELLAAMSQSTRRKIRQSEKRDVQVRSTTDETELRTLYTIYAETGDRQEFTIRPWTYYQRLWTSFLQAGLAHVLVAEHNGTILSGAVLFHFGQRVWYFYGMSSNEERDRQPNYAVQWAAIQWAKAQGYRTYDWWGAPNEFQEDDPMWGVYRFKRGFGSTIVRTVGAWDYTPWPPLYWLYTKAAPRFVAWLRRRGG
jgi:peptidoglycan pentaglycine glycine transferase (the first glycine)